MKRTSLLCFAAMLCITSLATAQPVEVGGEPPGAKPATKPSDGTIIPQLSFDAIPLDDVVDYLRDQVPGFNAVVVRDPGVPDNYPTLKHIKLRNVDVNQFMEFIQRSYTNVSWDNIDGKIHILRVHADPQMFPPGAYAPPGGNAPPPEAMQPQVNVYKLSNIVDALKGGTAVGSKDPLDDVLSLIQAALEQSGGTGDAVLKVHPQTQVLLFKGPPEKNAVVQQVLATLEPNPQDQVHKLQNEVMRVREMYDRAQRERDDDHARALAISAELEKASLERDAYRQELERRKEQKASTRPKE